MAAPHLSCGMQDLLSSLWHARSLVAACPGGPVVKTPHSQCRVPGSIAGQETRSTWAD